MTEQRTLAWLTIVVLLLSGVVFGWVGHATLRANWVYRPNVVCDAGTCVGRR